MFLGTLISFFVGSIMEGTSLSMMPKYKEMNAQSMAWLKILGVSRTVCTHICLFKSQRCVDGIKFCCISNRESYSYKVI